MMTVKRQPLPRWGYPNKETLSGNIFPSGKPPFAPFPTVTNLLNANFCPVAIYHDLLHGIDDALIPQYGEEKQQGDLFHKFIAHLKLSLKNGKPKLSGYDTQAKLGMIQDLFLPFSQRHGYSLDASSEIWRRYIEPWARRKVELRELEGISKEDQLVFELSVSSAYVPFALESGARHYPLRGRIDEVDLSRKRIVERTIKGSPSDTEPPLLKGYQAWLLWKILCSLKKKQLPSRWNSINFGDFDLFVETPCEDFHIPHENSDYIRDTHYAYAWINDISTSESPGVFREFFENARCTPENPDPECKHKFLICFPHNYPYPQSRPEIKQIFKPWYRLLLWEQTWEGHLFQYQLLRLSRGKLKELGLIAEGKIVPSTGSRIELEIINKEIGSIRGYDRYTIIPFGTLFCGKKMSATLTGINGNRLIMDIEGERDTLSEDALLLPSQSDLPSPMMQEPPTYLKKQRQGALLRLQNSGVEKPESAQRSSQIQVLGAIFGMRPLRRGSK